MLELSAAAQEYFERSRHTGSLAAEAFGVVEVRVGEPVSGYVLQLQLQVNTNAIIATVRFKAYGCGWLIACGSLLGECIEGCSLAQAGHFRHHALVEKLDIPPAKLHCAVLAETALKKALRTLSIQRTEHRDGNPETS